MLEGIRVIELGTVITAPLTGMMLGDLGADVIKVERPEGDPFRRSHGDDYGPTFVAYNRNKRSIVLDLTIERDRQTLLDLIDRCDVLLDNFRPTVLGKLGLAPEVLRERNPRLIQCSITGFGATGPYSDRPAFDAVGLALSGVASLFVDPQNPEAFGPTISDNVTGMNACCAILAALVERARTGRGRRIEVNMLEATMAFSPDAFTNFTRAGTVSDRLTRVATSQSFAFSCADRNLLAIHLSTARKVLARAPRCPGSPGTWRRPAFRQPSQSRRTLRGASRRTCAALLDPAAPAMVGTARRSRCPRRTDLERGRGARRSTGAGARRRV